MLYKLVIDEYGDEFVGYGKEHNLTNKYGL
jgi:hypothetical protein